MDVGCESLLLHSIAFAPAADLHGRVVGTTREGFTRAMGISCHPFIRMARCRAPVPHEVEIDDVGSFCAYLVSAAAQAVTGDIHYVDGGFHILA